MIVYVLLSGCRMCFFAKLSLVASACVCVVAYRLCIVYRFVCVRGCPMWLLL